MTRFLLWLEKSLFWAETLPGYQCPPLYSSSDQSIVQARKSQERRRDLSSRFAAP